MQLYNEVLNFMYVYLHKAGENSLMLLDITSVTSAQLGTTFQEFPKCDESTSSWWLLLIKSLLMFPSKLPQRPHTRPFTP